MIMLNGYIIAFSFGAVAVILLSLFVFLRNPLALLNRLFLIFSVSAAAWLTANYFGSTASVPYEIALISNRLTFLFSALGTFALYLFAMELVQAKRGHAYKAVAILNIANLLMAATPDVVTDITPSHGTYGIRFGFAANLYFATLLLNVILTLTVLVRARRKTPSVTQSQISTVLLSFAIFLIGVFCTNAVLPLFLNYYGLTNAGALFIFVLIGGMGYAITKHRLFHVRIIVARSLTYIASLGSLAVAFSLITLLLTNGLADRYALDRGQMRIIYTVLAMILALVFPPVKRFFDRGTNRLFYRDSYDTQVFFDNFNKVLVATYQLAPLLKKSAQILEDNLKPAFTVFGLKETGAAPRRIMGTSGHPDFTEADIAFVRKLTPKMRRKLVVTDMLEEKYGELQKVLQANNIAVMARLASSANEEGIGYLVLGPKKSGNLYSSQDLKNIEIVANELVIAIQNALRFEEIANFNLTLQAKVDEATRNLRKANERLKELDETKDDFISMASHQLRTPLTSVKGYISMVLEGDAGKINETQRKLLEQSFFSSQRMVFLISDLLNVSRLRTGKFVIEPTPVNLADMVEQEMDQLRETAAGKELTLTYEKPKEFPSIMLDETKTRQVIMNFVDNAIYYTPAGGHIGVELRETPASVELRVVDDGIGVPKAEQHHLFTKFYRAGNARKARPDGTGLGLFMAKKVVVAQGGAIIFESAEDKGSTFGFVFSKTKLASTDKNQESGTKNQVATVVK
jgi:signal transduction histidine kinase